MPAEQRFVNLPLCWDKTTHPSHSRTEAFPKRPNAVRGDSLPRAVQEAGVRASRCRLYARLEDLHSCVNPDFARLDTTDSHREEWQLTTSLHLPYRQP